MKLLILRALIHLAITLLLQNTKVQELIREIKSADLNESDPFKKRGIVYQFLKSREGAKSVSTLNALVEMGYQLYQITKK